MSKYDLEFKLSVIRYLEKEGASKKSASKHFGVNASCIRKWVWAYEYHGLEGLKHRNGSYSAEFKESVVRYKKQNHLSGREVAARFNIPGPATIQAWERRYDEGGIQALTDQRGQKKSMSKHLNESPRKPLEEMSQEEMHAELQYLRAENAYLKKLKALIRQKKESVSKLKQDSSSN